MALDYKKAGVDVEAGYESVKLIKEHVKKTFNKNVLTELGGFGGLFSLSDMKAMEEPVLVSGTDGVGTKLKIAFLMDKHDSIGIDAVAMCVNDIICSGAKPLFFLDYIACGKNYPTKIAQIVKGVSEGCCQSNCALIGGETAEMPGFYPEDEYDIAGFAVGIVDKKKMIDGSKIKSGDALIGIASSGIHSNGYSLVRKLFDMNSECLSKTLGETNSTVGEILLKPTRIYVNAIEKLKHQVSINGISHITGGGFIENIPRMLPDGCRAEIKEGTWPILDVFKVMQQKSGLTTEKMFNTFNMGIGMVVAVPENDAEKAVNTLNQSGEKAYIIGKVLDGEKGVSIC